MRAPKKENPALGADEFANNHFLFDDDTFSRSLIAALDQLLVRL